MSNQSARHYLIFKQARIKKPHLSFSNNEIERFDIKVIPSSSEVRYISNDKQQYFGISLDEFGTTNICTLTKRCPIIDMESFDIMHYATENEILELKKFLSADMLVEVDKTRKQLFDIVDASLFPVVKYNDNDIPNISGAKYGILLDHGCRTSKIVDFGFFGGIATTKRVPSDCIGKTLVYVSKEGIGTIIESNVVLYEIYKLMYDLGDECT